MRPVLTRETLANIHIPPGEAALVLICDNTNGPFPHFPVTGGKIMIPDKPGYLPGKYIFKKTK